MGISPDQKATWKTGGSGEVKRGVGGYKGISETCAGP